ncbi:unnamed protein product, partial [Prorocentrum cordatum]
MVRGAPVKQPGAAEGAPHASRDCVRRPCRGARRPALGLRVCLGSEPRRCRGAAPRAGRAGRRAPATRGGAAARRDAHGGRRPAPRRRRAARRLAGRPGAGPASLLASRGPPRPPGLLERDGGRGAERRRVDEIVLCRHGRAGRAGALGRRAGELLVSRRAAPSRGAAVQAIDRALRAAEREAGAPLGTEAAQSLGALAADVRRLREATRLLLRRARGRLPRPRGASEGGVAAPAKETGCMRREAIGSTYQKHSVWLMVRRA